VALRRTPGWASLQRRALGSRFDWQAPATAYLELYRRLVQSRLADQG
jgi:glycogen synthase